MSKKPMTDACHICWTSSWAPCEKNEEGAINFRGEWVLCQMCQAEKWSRQHRERNKRLREIAAAIIEAWTDDMSPVGAWTMVMDEAVRALSKEIGDVRTTN